MKQTAPTPPTGGARTFMIIVLLASNLMASLMQSLMNVALDAVSTEFGITLSQANWMVLGFTIVTGTVITTAATLLKRFGLRIVIALGYLFALSGSLLGFFAWNYPAMVAARLLQAVTTGLYFPLINEALLMLAPNGKAGKLMALNSGVIGFGLAFAPPLSGLVITYAGLHELFIIPAAMAAVLAVAGHFAIHNLFPREKKRIDALSIVLSFSGLACFMYGLNELPHQLFPPIAIMAAGIALLALFVWRQLRIKDPLLNLKPLGNHVFSIGELLVALAFMASVYMSLLVPLYLEGAASYTPFIAGCLCVAPILCYALSCFASGPLLEKHGVWPLIPAGFALVLTGYVGMQLTSSHLLILAVLVCAAASYAGIGIFFPALKSVNLESLSKELSSHGSSIHSTIVQIASSISSALYVGILSGDVDGLMAHGISKADAYAAGFSHTLLIEIGVLVAAVALSVIYVRIVKKSRKQP